MAVRCWEPLVIWRKEKRVLKDALWPALQLEGKAGQGADDTTGKDVHLLTGLWKEAPLCRPVILIPSGLRWAAGLESEIIDGFCLRLCKFVRSQRKSTEMFGKEPRAQESQDQGMAADWGEMWRSCKQA